MSTDAGSGKKAVHVKWAGKTIALGTFTAQEAELKCARAKALTRAWRSTVRPRPTREWVMEELERQGVRVVNGRLGRKEGDDTGSSDQAAVVSGVGPSNETEVQGNNLHPGDPNVVGAVRRNSSIGLSLLSDVSRNPLASVEASLFAKGPDSAGLQIPPHRPYKGGSAAAAYEAAFFDHCLRKNEEQQRRISGIASGSLPGSAAGVAAGTNPDQHYEMLKLHHMNLLNEIQETTLMMNLFQQQHLQQHLQTGAASLNNTIAQTNLGQMLNSAQMAQHQQQQPTLGLGGAQFGIGNLSVQQLLQLQNQQRLLNGDSSNQASIAQLVSLSSSPMLQNALVGNRVKRSNDDDMIENDEKKRQKSNDSTQSDTKT